MTDKAKVSPRTKRTKKGWKKLKPIEGGNGGCLCCGYQHDILPMKALIAVGFGMAQVTRDGEIVYDEMEAERAKKPLRTARWAENRSAKDPNHDWRIGLVAPLSERHYQRQGAKHWVLYEKGMGFA